MLIVLSLLITHIIPLIIALSLYHHSLSFIIYLSCMIHNIMIVNYIYILLSNAIISIMTSTEQLITLVGSSENPYPPHKIYTIARDLLVTIRDNGHKIYTIARASSVIHRFSSLLSNTITHIKSSISKEIDSLQVYSYQIDIKTCLIANNAC